MVWSGRRGENISDRGGTRAEASAKGAPCDQWIDRHPLNGLASLQALTQESTSAGLLVKIPPPQLISLDTATAPPAHAIWAHGKETSPKQEINDKNVRRHFLSPYRLRRARRADIVRAIGIAVRPAPTEIRHQRRRLRVEGRRRPSSSSSSKRVVVLLLGRRW